MRNSDEPIPARPVPASGDDAVPCGRSPLLTENKRREICEILSAGGRRRLAARYVGCTVDLICRTAARDPEFAAQLVKAEANAEILFLRRLQTASEDVKQWRAALMALERLFPARYARRKPRTITLEELAVALRELGASLMSEIPDENVRRRVLTRLDELAGARGQEGTADDAE